MKTTCRSCGSALWIPDDSAAHRVRCRTCGTTNDMEAQNTSPSQRQASPRLMMLSRTDAMAAMRTIVLRIDGTTELHAGAEGDAVLAVGAAPRGTVLAWQALRTAADAGQQFRVEASSEGCEYDLVLGAARLKWTGVPHAESAQLWSMLSALWSTLEQSPL